MLGGILGAILISAISGSDRLDLHNKVAQNFEQTVFFEDGRGMTLSPDFINVYEFLAWMFDLSKPRQVVSPEIFGSPISFNRRWGIVNHDKELKGFFNVSYKDLNVGALGCVACHSGKAAGIYITGLGNKNIDPGQVGEDAYRSLKMWQALHFWKDKSNDYRDIEDRSIHFARRLKNERHTNLTQGMVPVALIQQWFYLQAGRDLPEGHGRGAVKVPHFWGYGEKRFVGQFSDGFGDGAHPGWGLLVELVGGQSVEGAERLMPRVAQLEDDLAHILPPRYPFEVNASKSAQGKKIFEQFCSGCHGTYEQDSEGWPVFKAPQLIAHSKVKTDPDRLNIITNDFLNLVHTNPLNHEIRIKPQTEKGYFAPRLEGIWSRFPYLHNASVPSIRALLTAPERRPKVWSLRDAGERERFDEKDLGLKVPAKFELKDLQRKAKSEDREVYDVTRPGHSNQGHWFQFSPQLSEQDIDALIEYLKTI
jgi:hypothetical protein